MVFYGKGKPVMYLASVSLNACPIQYTSSSFVYIDGHSNTYQHQGKHSLTKTKPCVRKRVQCTVCSGRGGTQWCFHSQWHVLHPQCTNGL